MRGIGGEEQRRKKKNRRVRTRRKFGKTCHEPPFPALCICLDFCVRLSIDNSLVRILNNHDEVDDDVLAEGQRSMRLSILLILLQSSWSSRKIANRAIYMKLSCFSSSKSIHKSNFYLIRIGRTLLKKRIFYRQVDRLKGQENSNQIERTRLTHLLCFASLLMDFSLTETERGGWTGYSCKRSKAWTVIPAQSSSICKKVQVISAVVHLLPAGWNVDEKKTETFLILLLHGRHSLSSTQSGGGQRLDFSTDAVSPFLPMMEMST